VAAGNILKKNRNLFEISQIYIPQISNEIVRKKKTPNYKLVKDILCSRVSVRSETRSTVQYVTQIYRKNNMNFLLVECMTQIAETMKKHRNKSKSF